MKYIRKFNESNENDTNQYIDCLDSLKKVSNGIHRQEVILWFNENDIDYFNMNDLDMYIYYIEKNADTSSSEFDHNLSNLKKGTNNLGNTYYYKDSEKDGYIDVAQRDRLGRVTGWMTVKSGSGIYESNVNESFKTKAQKLIDDTKKLKDDYPEKKYNKILELEKLIDGSDEDKKKFVKSIMRLLGMTKWDLPDDLYKYL